MQSPAVEGPYFDELAIGQDLGRAPGLTLTPGLAAAHQAITGDRLAHPHDHEQCHQVTGAMLPLRDQASRTGHADDLDSAGHPPAPASLQVLTSGWRLDRFARQADGPRLRDLRPGQSWPVAGGDVVSGAPELARLTLNVAAVHHDAAAGGRRLVYGGHVIGLALAQAVRSLPSIVTVAAWHGCDHLGPVHEGDTLRSTISVEQVEELPGGGGLVHLRSQVQADGSDGSPPRDALDWRYITVVA